MASQGNLILISIIIPVFNEEDAIEPFLRRVAQPAETACRLVGPDMSYELLFVDDGSQDGTYAYLMEARLRQPEIEVVSLSRNFGKDAALTAGLHNARGRVIIPMDVDLQDPPEVLPEMVRHWQSGAEVVNVKRSDRLSDTSSKRISAEWFYKVYNRLAERPIPENVGDFRLLDRVVVDALLNMPERARFMKGLVSWVGFHQETVQAKRELRTAGSSKWRPWPLWNFALDGFAGSTTVPLRIWTYIGSAIALSAFLYSLFLVVRRIVAGTDTPGYTSLMVVMLLFGGINFMALGIMGEYIGRIAAEVRGRPLYIERRSTLRDRSAAKNGLPATADVVSASSEESRSA
ncbi:glycosyltransferase [Pleomorphomonas diazotrophica]|uniref:Glycosyltransferase n=1 Tax=Pleomorphomonas diazotrophica TaxID=1166257 RepID=A0A1I4T7D5_9HYPH|nr:glycosyltransferase family 2 protein [Pleomorphomonas diazotrophica]PKR89510.1 glycosyltransferase [Pleomorphomonas diazotrophica]SFM72698.1 Glycosyltransferase involved in cell wall bisynthesis [Pleomorphomonas diazotrophica]